MLSLYLICMCHVYPIYLESTSDHKLGQIFPGPSETFSWTRWNFFSDRKNYFLGHNHLLGVDCEENSYRPSLQCWNSFTKITLKKQTKQMVLSKTFRNVANSVEPANKASVYKTESKSCAKKFLQKFKKFKCQFCQHKAIWPWLSQLARTFLI